MVRYKANPGALQQLAKTPEMLAMVAARGRAVAAACNAESSWGGYGSDANIEPGWASAVVWSVSSNLSGEHNRHQRLIRNLDAGR